MKWSCCVDAMTLTKHRVSLERPLLANHLDAPSFLVRQSPVLVVAGSTAKPMLWKNQRCRCSISDGIANRTLKFSVCQTVELFQTAHHLAFAAPN